MTADVGLVERALSWADDDPDPSTADEVRALVKADDLAALEACFEPPLGFGTAGLRGVVGAGPARMNLAVIRRTTRAVAEHLLATVPSARALPVVVGFDARRSSRAFAESVIAVLEAARIPVRYFERPIPTPLVAYAVRRLGASAGIVVTASHNPAEYNGYKLYGGNGSQIVPPVDQDVERRIRSLGTTRAIPLGGFRFDGHEDGEAVARVGEGLVESYLDGVDLLRPPGAAERGFPVVYTPLHGVGGALALRALARAGFSDVRVVREQAEPDGDFPTVAFPNPEEPGALDLAIGLAGTTGAELVLANDPDADRLAVAVRSAAGRLVPLSGNQIGVLLADFLLSRAPSGQRSLVVWSVVSSPLLASVAAAAGARAERTLTGFKWISLAGLELEAREGLRVVLGYEEALGFAVGRDVRDKDGISAAVVFAELVAQARARGEGVLDQLARIHRRHGLWASAQKSVVRSGPAGVAALVRAVDALAASPPASVAGHAVTAVRDYRLGASTRAPWLGSTPLVELELGDEGRVLLRPSGTEPKLKIYVDLCEAVGPSASVWDAEARLADAARGVSEAVAAIVERG